MGMNAFDIIEAAADTEGYPISRDAVVYAAIRDLCEGKDLAYQYGDVLFTVGWSDCIVHMYSLGVYSLRPAARQFMIDLWDLPQSRFFAPILNKKLGRVAQSFGWEPTGRILPTAHHVYIARRPI